MLFNVIIIALSSIIYRFYLSLIPSIIEYKANSLNIIMLRVSYITIPMLIMLLFIDKDITTYIL